VHDRGLRRYVFPSPIGISLLTLSMTAIFCGCAPSLSVLIKTYAPAVFGSSNVTSAKSPSASYFMQRQRTPLKSNRRLGQGDITLGSQDAIVTGGNAEQNPDQDGIVMKTDIQMDVSSAKSAEDVTYKREYYEFTKRA